MPNWPLHAASWLAGWLVGAWPTLSNRVLFAHNKLKRTLASGDCVWDVVTCLTMSVNLSNSRRVRGCLVMRSPRGEDVRLSSLRGVGDGARVDVETGLAQVVAPHGHSSILEHDLLEAKQMQLECEQRQRKCGQLPY